MIPEHLANIAWYAPHQAWLRQHGYYTAHYQYGIEPSRADLTGADLTRAVLTDADLTRAVLTRAVLTRAVLTRAVLTGAVLTRAVLTRAVLTRAVLTRADLTGADLTGADLTRADLTGADLTGAVLTDADLTDAGKIPAIENLDAKIIECIDNGGGLEMLRWHTCATTHCRAGWAITLAGKAGEKLEDRFGSAAAGALIYHKSTGRVPDFYASNEEAMADMRECAVKQTATV